MISGDIVDMKFRQGILARAICDDLITNIKMFKVIQEMTVDGLDDIDALESNHNKLIKFMMLVNETDIKRIDGLDLDDLFRFLYNLYSTLSKLEEVTKCFKDDVYAQCEMVRELRDSNKLNDNNGG